VPIDFNLRGANSSLRPRCDNQVGQRLRGMAPHPGKANEINIDEYSEPAGTMVVTENGLL
jgi:hypothetical protein